MVNSHVLPDSIMVNLYGLPYPIMVNSYGLSHCVMVSWIKYFINTYPIKPVSSLATKSTGTVMLALSKEFICQQKYLSILNMREIYYL
ncbi:hypothetical protein TRVA0_004S00870 [Trichomonascus vanleenenianus]|uniref:uncharacterized protein n=1 Tax=Trichomonascus vanleenenianus TaxID=2268995 RepID=UPI003ECA821E